MFTRLVVATVAALLASSTAALADPSARVARISFIGGGVSFRPASLTEWSAATLNYPLTVGDHMWTDRGARGELQLGSTVIRVAPQSELSLLNLDDHTAQLRVTEGAVSIRVRALTDGDVLEIDTPNGAVSVLRAGLYRVEVNEAGDSSTVTVREGEADIDAGSTAFLLRRDQSAVVAGLDIPQADVRAAVRIDDFEDWCLTRDRRMDTVRAAQYVSPEMIGYEDLDANGTWEVAAEYGPVWMPRVRAEWVPYRFGRWAWVEPWGWTWIDEAPWGFAPFHYGRWAFLPARGWAWVPGTRVARPVYAPALVAFVGGPNWNVSARLGSGPVGWFPLGPREVYVPAYRVTPEYVRRVNVAHVTTVNATTVNVTTVTYVNRAVPGAITAVSRETFAQARPVATAAFAIAREQAQAATVVRMAAVAPQRESIAGPTRATSTPAAAVVARQVVVRTAPPPEPAPFAARQAALAQHPGEPMDASSENAIRAQASPVPNPWVRAIAKPRSAPGGQPATAPSRTPARAPAPTAPAQPPPSGAPPANAAAPRPTAPIVAPPAARSASPQAAGDLAARHAQERAEIDARHAQERAALQARHAQERQASAAPQRAQLQQRHQEEMQALHARQRLEREAAQRRQQEERKNKGSR